MAGSCYASSTYVCSAPCQAWSFKRNCLLSGLPVPKCGVACLLAATERSQPLPVHIMHCDVGGMTAALTVLLCVQAERCLTRPSAAPGWTGGSWCTTTATWPPTWQPLRPASRTGALCEPGAGQLSPRWMSLWQTQLGHPPRQGCWVEQVPCHDDGSLKVGRSF